MAVSGQSAAWTGRPADDLPASVQLQWRLSWGKNAPRISAAGPSLPPYTKTVGVQLMSTIRYLTLSKNSVSRVLVGVE